MWYKKKGDILGSLQDMRRVYDLDGSFLKKLPPSMEFYILVCISTIESLINFKSCKIFNYQITIVFLSDYPDYLFDFESCCWLMVCSLSIHYLFQRKGGAFCYCKSFSY